MSDQHHHDMPPPEADDLALGPVVFWGVSSFVAIVVVIIALGSYFWIERGARRTKVMQSNKLAAELKEAEVESARRLGTIEKAMQQLAGQSEIK
ncbi:MAG: hypothetical protein H6701_14495 [Myxococcales bacterium]|nr:hypothetical protein [Myxococcales bacterium]